MRSFFLQPVSYSFKFVVAIKLESQLCIHAFLDKHGQKWKENQDSIKKKLIMVIFYAVFCCLNTEEKSNEDTKKKKKKILIIRWNR